MQKKKKFYIVYKLDPKTKYRLIFHLKLLLLIDINSVRINCNLFWMLLWFDIWYLYFTAHDQQV